MLTISNILINFGGSELGFLFFYWMQREQIGEIFYQIMMRSNENRDIISRSYWKNGSL